MSNKKNIDNSIIDLQLGTKLAGNKDELAKDMLSLLASTLPDEMNEIRQAKENHQLPELLKAIHKLHGAVCYCGVPRLKNALASFETILKQKNILKIDKNFAELELAVAQVLEAASHLGK